MQIVDLDPEECIGLAAKVYFQVTRPCPIVGEWMWVTITEVVDGRFIGRLGNSPAHARGLEHGDMVMFRAEDVFLGEVYVPGTEGFLDPVSRGDIGRRHCPYVEEERDVEAREEEPN